MDMSLGMDIASYSMANASLSVMSNVSVAMLDKTLDLQKTMGDNITKMMEQSVNPSLGGNIREGVPLDMPMRFDVIAIEGKKIWHFIHAFDADGWS